MRGGKQYDQKLPKRWHLKALDQIGGGTNLQLLLLIWNGTGGVGIFTVVPKALFILVIGAAF
jgi:hypothetical protein